MDNKTISGILSQPFPRDNSFRKCLRTAIATGFFVAVFLWVFKPFGIALAPVAHPDLFILGYGAVSFFLALLVYPVILLFPKFFLEENWTVGKNITHFSAIIFFIGLANLVYTHYFAGLPLSAGTFFSFQIYTMAVAILIASVFTFVRYTRTQHLNRIFAEEIDKEVQKFPTDFSEKKFTIRSEQSSEILELSNKSLLFIVSADNYSKVCFLKSGKPEMMMIRASLKRLNEQMNFPFIFRCHRSYIVNLENVEKVKGNSQGYRLHFAGTDEAVPVSRRTGLELQTRLHALRGK